MIRQSFNIKDCIHFSEETAGIFGDTPMVLVRVTCFNLNSVMLYVYGLPVWWTTGGSGAALWTLPHLAGIASTEEEPS